MNKPSLSNVTPVPVADWPGLEQRLPAAVNGQPREETLWTLAAFPELNPQPVFELSREGAVVYHNPAAAALAKAAGGGPPAALLPAGAAAIAQACLATGQSKCGVESVIAGHIHAWSFLPFPQRGTVHCYAVDATERQRLEAQLRHSQKIESVGRLAAGVAHDFNNVLTVIQGHTGLLRNDASLSGPAQEAVQQIARAAERAAKLTSQLLAFSRRTFLQPRRVDLNELLTSLSSLLHRTLGEDIHYQFNYASDLPPLLADAGMLEQVVLNLAVNSRDAMPRGGQLLVSTALVDIDAACAERHPGEARPGRFVCLTISDTGCGMDSVTQGRMFEPFFTTKEFGKGTGLGLATVYGIVRQHKGWIDVQSQLGQGTTFRIYLPPMDPAAQEQPAPVPGPDAFNGRETVLLVEDEPPVRWIIKDVLERHGYQVLEAGSGIEALAQWHQHHDAIALLLTDVVMPAGLNGHELAERFQAQKPGLRVMYISGYSLQVAGKDYARAEAVNFLQKPFDGARLAMAVRQCLDY